MPRQLAALFSYEQYQEAQQGIALGLSGIGKASGATVNDIERISEASAEASKTSVSSAREVVTALAKTGRIDVGNLPGVANLAKGFGLLNGKSTEDDRARAAVEAYKTQIGTLKSEYEQGGTAAAAALRQANFQAQVVGLSAYARGLAEINRQYDEQIIKAREAKNTQVIPALESAEGTATSAYNASYLNQPSNYFKSVSDAPDQYQAAFLAAGSKYGVDPNLLSSVAFQESRYNPNAVSPKGATGLMQIMPDTAAGLGVDPKDAMQSIDGAAKLLSQLLQRYNQDVSLALIGYNAGPTRADRVAKSGNIADAPAESRDYVQRITQKTPDLKSQTAMTTEWDRSLQNAGRTLVSLQDNLGKSSFALAKAEEQQRLENAAVASGLPLSDELKKSIEDRATAYADLAQKTAAVKLGAQNEFALEQLGRTPEEQTRAATLRSAGIDGDAPSGKALNDQMERLQNLTTAKTEGSTFTKGLVDDLIRGTTAGKALENQLQRILGKLADSAVDSLFASLFGSVLGKGGSSGGTGILSGIGSLFHLASGGRVIGPGSGTSDSVPAMLSHGEFVVNAKSASKNAGLLAAMNSGNAIRLAAGGMVGSMPVIPSAVASSGGSATGHTVHMTVDARGAQGNSEIQGMIAQGVSKGMQKVHSDIRRNILSYASEAKRRNF